MRISDWRSDVCSSDLRLGPGRIHHCMRTIGVAEEAIAKMAKRLQSRVAFGRTVAEYSIWEHRLARARLDIQMTLRLCPKATDLMDQVGNHSATAQTTTTQDQAPNTELKSIHDTTTQP